MNNETLKIIMNAIVWLAALTFLYKTGMYMLNYYMPLHKPQNANKSKHSESVAKALEEMKE